MGKKFIITIDTEGDNLWQWKRGSSITTKNSAYLQRFQELCDKYCYKPTYLTNYEMLNDQFFVEFASHTLHNHKCEIGMHLHAWNSPPHYEELEYIQSYGAPYLIEYPLTIMEEKIKILTHELEDTFCQKMLSHRAGRWAMNSHYFDLLISYGYKYDCSVTPHVNWSNSPGATLNSKGSNYLTANEKPYKVFNANNSGYITEVPMTIRKAHAFLPYSHTIKDMTRAFLDLAKGKILWMRPNLYNTNDLLYLVELIKKTDDDYLMFMLHSSELMPGGSPYFKNEAEIERLYEMLEVLFENIRHDYFGITLNSLGVDR